MNSIGYVAGQVNDFLGSIGATVTRWRDESHVIDDRRDAAAFRVVWLRRALVAVWVIGVILAAISLVIDLVEIGQYAVALIEMSHRRGGDDFGYLLRGYFGSLGAFNLVLDLWTVAGLVVIAKTWNKVRRGAPIPYKPVFLFATLAVVMGRSTTFLWSFLMAMIPDWLLLIPVKYGLAPPLMLFLGGIGEMLAAYLGVTAFILSFFVIPMQVMNAALRIMQDLTTAKAMKMPFLGAVMQFWLWFNGRAAPQNNAPDDSRGARFAVPDEIAAVMGEGATFGYIGDVPVTIANNKHTFIQAANRGGKGVGLIIPAHLEYEGSIFSIDPKGENARVTYRHRRALNERVLVLDPFGITGLPRARFNPLARLTAANMESEAKALAEALIMGDADHWTSGARQLLAGLILYVVTSDDIPQGQKDLVTVRKLLLGAMNDVLQSMVQSTAVDGLLSLLASSFIATPEKEFGSILSTAQRQTDILDNPQIAACMAASGHGEEVDFANFVHGTMTVFLCLSAPKFAVFNRWLRLVLTSALNEMTEVLSPPEKPVRFILDELATLGHMQVVEDAIGLAAGYGVEIWSVWQDLSQLKAIYRQRWASFIGNAGVRVVFNVADFESAEYWSRFMGGRLVETRSQNVDTLGLAHGGGIGETVRPLMTPEEIMMAFSGGKMLVLAHGARPFVVDRVPYYANDDFYGLWDDAKGV